jgi:hypothetical protein
MAKPGTEASQYIEADHSGIRTVQAPTAAYLERRIADPASGGPFAATSNEKGRRVGAPSVAVIARS